MNHLQGRNPVSSEESLFGKPKTYKKANVTKWENAVAENGDARAVDQLKVLQGYLNTTDTAENKGKGKTSAML